MQFIEKFFDTLFSIIAKAYLTACAGAFILDKVLNVNIIKFF